MNKTVIECRYILNLIFLVLMLIYFGCSKTEPEHVYFKTENREQLEKRAVEECHGNFMVLKEIKFGPYTKALLKCNQ